MNWLNVLATIDLTEVPEALGEALGIGTFSGEILLSVFVIMIIVCIVAIFTRDTIVLIIFTLLGITLDIAFGWLDYFFLIFACLIVALLYANTIRDILKGD